VQGGQSTAVVPRPPSPLGVTADTGTQLPSSLPDSGAMTSYLWDSSTVSLLKITRPHAASTTETLKNVWMWLWASWLPLFMSLQDRTACDVSHLA
jgi:hypothetical protein